MEDGARLCCAVLDSPPSITAISSDAARDGGPTQLLRRAGERQEVSADGFAACSCQPNVLAGDPTPKALNLIAQGRERSERTLGHYRR